MLCIGLYSHIPDLLQVIFCFAASSRLQSSFCSVAGSTDLIPAETFLSADQLLILGVGGSC